jgi:membrane-associated phospholipid phosphatase
VLLVLSLYSRAYVGNHHVLDTLAGVVLGGVVGMVDLIVAEKLGLLSVEPDDDAAVKGELETGEV